MLPQTRLVGAIVALIISTSGVRFAAPSQSRPQTSGKPAAPLNVALSFAEAPLLDRPVDLIAVVTPLVDAPSTTVSFFLPDGFQLERGDRIWMGDLARDTTTTFSLTVRATKPGLGEVRAEVIVVTPGGGAFGRAARLYATVELLGSTVSAQAPAVAHETLSLAARLDPGRIAAPSALTPSPKTRPYAELPLPAPDAPTAVIHVYGFWRYEDRDGNPHPVRDARVEVWDEDSTSADDLLGVTHTDLAGFYTVTVPQNDVVGGQDIYIKVISTDDHAAAIQDFTGARYGVKTTTTDDVPDGPFFAGVQTISSATNRMVWFILDKIAVDAWYYLNGTVGWDNDYLLVVNWTPSSSDGTYYNSGGAINMLAGDRWDEDVLLHEFGHFVMDKIYAAYPPTPSCNPHHWGVHSSEGCALSEGWANFLQGAIQGHQDYIDTEDQTLHHYLEPPTPAANHPEDEGAVAASLWDIFDSGVETWDSLSDGLNGTADDGIWDVFFNGDPNTIEEFWNAWGASNNGHCAALWAILDHHVIDYDTSAPTDPTSVSSASHTPSTWSTDNTVAVSWSGAADACGSGVAGYSTYWSTSASSLPDATSDTTGSSATSPGLSDGTSWYFHLRTVDAAGNWNAGAVHRGPYWIDTLAPANPASVSSSSHATGTWSADNTIAVSWSGAGDGSGSGVSGYSYQWSTAAATLPDAVSDTTGSSNTSPGLGDSPSWYFHVRARDTAGNWNASAVHLGPFKIDATAPNCAVTGLPVTTTAISTTLIWSGADSGGSGLKNYDLQYRVGASGAWTSWLNGTTATRAAFGPAQPVALAPGVTYYYRCRATDNAGNAEPFPGGNGDTDTTFAFRQGFLAAALR